MKLRVLTFFLIAVSVAGCTGQLETRPPAPPEQADFSFEPYRMGVGDSLRIDVWRNAQLSLTVPVRPDGMISMPLIGDVLAASQTTAGLASTIANLLEDYVRNPQVTVIVMNPSSASFVNRVRVTGAVNSPKSIAYSKGMTVLDLILLAGGLNDFAAANSAKLYRNVEGKIKVYPLYLEEILERGNVQTNYQLVPSDIVTVPERSF